MQLSSEQIQSLTFGTVRVTKKDDAVRFYRFTADQSEAYRWAGQPSFYEKSFASAGVRISFRSRTDHVSFVFRPYPGSSRDWFDFDICCDKLMVAHREFNLHDDPSSFHMEATLPKGEKRIDVHFPFSVRIDLLSFSVDDGTEVTPAPRAHSMLEFGDSITQGYDTHYPSLSYTARLSELLDADAVNKGIGGDTFFPELLESGGDAYDSPDYITVAYGTNDWSHHTQEEFGCACKDFYRKLSARYPSSRIFAISPLWRGPGGLRTDTPFRAPLRETDSLIQSCIESLPNVTFLCGEYLVPNSPDFFIRDCLHPNELGFSQYAANLGREIKKHL